MEIGAIIFIIIFSINNKPNVCNHIPLNKQTYITKN